MNQKPGKWTNTFHLERTFLNLPGRSLERSGWFAYLRRIRRASYLVGRFLRLRMLSGISTRTYLQTQVKKVQQVWVSGIKTCNEYMYTEAYEDRIFEERRGEESGPRTKQQWRRRNRWWCYERRIDTVRLSSREISFSGEFCKRGRAG